MKISTQLNVVFSLLPYFIMVFSYIIFKNVNKMLKKSAI
jgi:hypothetical protein